MSYVCSKIGSSIILAQAANPRTTADLPALGTLSQHWLALLAEPETHIGVPELIDDEQLDTCGPHSIVARAQIGHTNARTEAPSGNNTPCDSTPVATRGCTASSSACGATSALSLHGSGCCPFHLYQNCTDFIVPLGSLLPCSRPRGSLAKLRRQLLPSSPLPLGIRAAALVAHRCTCGYSLLRQGLAPTPGMKLLAVISPIPRERVVAVLQLYPHRMLRSVQVL